MDRILSIRAEVKMFGRGVTIAHEAGTATISGITYEELLALVRAAQDSQGSAEPPVPTPPTPPAPKDQVVQGASTRLDVKSGR